MMQVDVSRKLNFRLIEVWDFLLSKQGMLIWLGTLNVDKWETGIVFSTERGITGKIRVFKLYTHIRFNWKLNSWKNNSLVHMRTIVVGESVILSFHQDGIHDETQQEAMQLYWNDILDEIECSLLARCSMR